MRRNESCSPAIYKTFKTGAGEERPAHVCQDSGMRPILTAEDVVKRIAAECAFVDDRGAVGIWLKPAAAIVRQYGEHFRARPADAILPPNMGGWSVHLGIWDQTHPKLWSRTAPHRRSSLHHELLSWDAERKS